MTHNSYSLFSISRCHFSFFCLSLVVCFGMTRRLTHPPDPQSCADWSFTFLVVPTMPDWSMGEGSDTTPALQVGSRLGAGLTTLPCYKLFVTEPSRGKPNCHYLGGLKHQDASMINLGESRGEARVRKEKTTPKNNMEENGGDKECRYWLGESYKTSPR